MPAVQNYDVVVIGAGGAVLLPQLKLRAKALTLFLLKNADVGGNSLISGAEMNSEFWVQNKPNIKDDTPARMAADTLKGGDFQGDPEIVGVMTTNALPTAGVGCETRSVSILKKTTSSTWRWSLQKKSPIPEGHTGTEVITVRS